MEVKSQSSRGVLESTIALDFERHKMKGYRIDLMHGLESFNCGNIKCTPASIVILDEWACRCSATFSYIEQEERAIKSLKELLEGYRKRLKMRV